MRNIFYRTLFGLCETRYISSYMLGILAIYSYLYVLLLLLDVVLFLFKLLPFKLNKFNILRNPFRLNKQLGMRQ